MIDGRRNFSRVYDFSNLVYVRRSIGRRWFARFLCIGKSSAARKKFAHTQKERERMMSDGSLYGQWQMDPPVHHPTSQMYLAALRSDGCLLISGTSYFEFFCRFFHVIRPDHANDPPIFRDHYARYLLSPIVRKEHLPHEYCWLYVYVYLRAGHRAISREKATIRARLGLTDFEKWSNGFSNITVYVLESL